MKIKKIDMKKAAVSCTAICLAGALCWSGNSMTAWAAPTSGTAINDNTRVRSAIGGNPIGSLKANQEVTIKEEQTSGDGYTWYEITFDWNGAETDGWVRSDMISSGNGTAAKDDTSDQADSSDTSDQNTEAQDGTFQISGKTGVCHGTECSCGKQNGGRIQANLIHCYGSPVELYGGWSKKGR